MFLRFLYDFEGTSLSQKPFHHQNLIWSQNRKKNRKCNQGPQNLVFRQKLEKFTICLRFFYDFRREPYQKRKKTFKKKRKYHQGP